MLDALLTKEQILEHKEYVGDDASFLMRSMPVAEAQHLKTLQKVVEWLQKRRLRWEEEPSNSFVMSVKDWQDLRQEAGKE